MPRLRTTLIGEHCGSIADIRFRRHPTANSGQRPYHVNAGADWPCSPRAALDW